MSANPLQNNVSGVGRRTSSPPARHDFSKIKTAISIPNLIEVQRDSYARFLQMDMLPDEREMTGLQAVFRSVFPISDFRGTAELDFVEYHIGNWQCKCGKISGLEYLRDNCRNCGSTIKVDPLSSNEVLCHSCGAFNAVRPRLCDECGEPVGLKHKHDQQECRDRGMTYSVPLKVKIRLIIHDKNADTGARTIRDVKEEEVFFGEIPLMTDNGTFIINGTERVIVSQLHRSPGVFFERETVDRSVTYRAKVIPYRGSWVQFEYDQKNLLYARFGNPSSTARGRKFLTSTFLRALGIWLNPEFDPKKFAAEAELEQFVENAEFTDEAILGTFYVTEAVRVSDGRLFIKVGSEGRTNLVGMASAKELKSRSNESIIRAGKKITTSVIKEIRKSRIKEVEVDQSEFEGAYALGDIVDTQTGDIMVEANSEIAPAKLQQIIESGVPSFNIFFPERDEIGPVLALTLKKDVASESGEELPEKYRKKPIGALIKIYRKMRPGDKPTVSTAYKLFESLFFDVKKFDMSRVGRLRFNIKMHKQELDAIEDPIERRARERERLNESLLSAADFTKVVSYLLKMRRNSAIYPTDDIDHLGNRRVRAVGELLENQFRIGLARMERAVKEKMAIQQEIQTTMPRDLINAKPVTAAVREFFGSSQLSQFMDQTNPLSELTHRRRLSALGPGGLPRERAKFDVRDVHPTHYGRICPIETPEGPNIGLISSLSCFARINEFGFIEAPYRKVVDGRVVDYVRIINGGDTKLRPGEHLPLEQVERLNKKVESSEGTAQYEPYPFYLTAWEEDKYVTGQANIELDEKGYIINERNAARKAGNFILARRENIEYVDVSPKQLVSVAASLVPFLENDDANRALMGANMQRQAVPLLRAESPYIGTGMERVTARDSGAVVLAYRDGIVDYVDSERIIIKADHNVDGTISREVTADIYTLVKFKRSNQNTCINQRAIVKVAERVEKGQVIADGPCTDRGELALGRNILVAFMPWRGYNFEDAILVSEKLVKDDYYTSIHIEELEIEARDTKLGPEEITRDIPNVGENMLRDLDESGIIRIGAQVKAGSILIGKVTPKGETQLTAEEKLLRAIFGEKAGDVKDASLKCPPGIDGTVVDVRVFTRKGQEKDSRSQAIEEDYENRLRRNLEDETRILNEQCDHRIYELFEGRKLASDLVVDKQVRISQGTKITREMLIDLEPKTLRKAHLTSTTVDVAAEIKEYQERTTRQIKILTEIYEDKISKLRQGDELAPGVIKMVRVFIAMKRKLSVGDKMAGRHGNKGVIARILPEEDMPYLPDGTPVEIVLNPLGVPSRMNLGQILETHLGWAARVLGLYFSTPVFDGATESEIKVKLAESEEVMRTNGLSEIVNDSGKTILHDGLTGEPFEQKVTVGYIYMLKLSHLVDDKVHARSIGPYSLITQQPLGGKAQFGGQRFGEMEVWALEAYGAAHILQELLTAKSDDVAGRSKIYEAIVKGEADFDPGVPESFNVLVRELQSLGLDVELVNSENGKDGTEAKTTEKPAKSAAKGKTTQTVAV